MKRIKKYIDQTSIKYLAIFLLIATTMTAHTLNRIENLVRMNTGSSLETVVGSTHESLYIWRNNMEFRADLLSKDEELKVYVQKLIEYRRRGADLIDSSPLKSLRYFFQERFISNEEIGFFIIAPDYTNIASMRDSNIGVTNFLSQNHELLLQKAFEGETIFVPPVPSDIPIRDIKGNYIPGYPSMFTITPVRLGNKIIAALAIRIDPFLTFTNIAHIGRIGISGETYFFNSKGELLTDTRFSEQLYQIDLLQKNESPILKIQIRDPGGDLTQGYISDTPQLEQPLTLMAQSAISKNNDSNTDGYRDYRGVPVMGAWLWDDTIGIGIATEIDVSEALLSYYRTRQFVIFALVFTALLGAIMIVLIEYFRKRNMAELNQAAIVFNNTNEGIVITNRNGVIERINPAFELITGYTKDEVVGKNIKILKSSYHSASFFKKFWATLTKEGTWKGEFHNKKKNGDDFVQESSIVSIEDADGNTIKYANIFRDITDRKKAQESLEQKSYSDGLTGIANRRKFNEALESEIKRALRTKNNLTLLLIDVDYFKLYNDLYGHQAGDLCLQKIAETFQGALNRAGDLAARYGGEEFAFILPSTDQEKAKSFAEKIRLGVSGLQIPHEQSKVHPYVTVSIGVATFTPNGGSQSDIDQYIDDLIQNADKALYTAKRNGRNTIFTI